VRACSQSAIDIETLVVADEMPELERFSLLFESGRPVQKLSVMLNLPTLVADYGADACETLITQLTEATPAIVRAASAGDDTGASSPPLALSGAAPVARGASTSCARLCWQNWPSLQRKPSPICSSRRRRFHSRCLRSS
jgi:hypothetical protein